MLKMKDDYAMNKTAQITRQRRSAKELDFAVKKNSERRRRCGRALTEYNNIGPQFFFVSRLDVVSFSKRSTQVKNLEMRMTRVRN